VFVLYVFCPDETSSLHAKFFKETCLTSIRWPRVTLLSAGLCCIEYSSHSLNVFWCVKRILINSCLTSRIFAISAVPSHGLGTISNLCVPMGNSGDEAWVDPSGWLNMQAQCGAGTTSCATHVVLLLGHRWHRHSNGHMTVHLAMLFCCITADWEMQCNQPHVPWGHVGLYMPAWHRVESHGLLSHSKGLQSWLINDVWLAAVVRV
jgi:hypothetical protein